MAKYTQARQPLAVTTPLGPDQLLLEKLSGYEELSRLFHFELDMLAESSTSIAFDKVLGQKITVSLKQTTGQVRYISGIVSEFTQGRRVLSPAGDEFVRYRAVMVPQFWLLTRRFQSRIFQQLSVPDILKQVLQGLDVSYQIQGTFEPRDYCVQYRESDFDFASRLMEEEGIFYFFEHSSDGHKLVLANTASSHGDVPAPSSVHYDDVEGGSRDEDRVFAWEKTQAVRSGKVTLWDYCFELPTQNLAASQVVQDSAQVGTVTHNLKAADNDKLEIYEYPGRYAQRFDGVDPGGGDQADNLQKIFSDNLRTAGIRMQEETATALQVRGQSHCRQFTAGYKFNLDRHPDGRGAYVLTRVEHEASLTGSYAAAEVGSLLYENRFQAIPPDLPFRPERRTPRPILAGTQTATVVGPSGQEIFLDKYGRVKVQFHWDRQGQNNAGSSCWVRVGQVWAGNRWGGFFWPRVGHEVIVAFEEGDPDQPVIVGSVYNAKLMPPFELPDNAMVGGIKSSSFGKNADPLQNFNGVVFYDELGNEHLQIHSENHEIYSTESTKHTRIGATNVHVVGTLIPSGSGSGSGDDSSNNKNDSDSSSSESEPPEDISAFNWPGTSGWGEWGKNVTVVVGQDLGSTLGLAGEVVLGSYIEVIINPLGWIGSKFTGPVGLGFASVMGEVNLVCGASTELVYGPKISIIRGTKTEYEGHVAVGSLVGAGVVSALYGASAVMQGLLGLTGEDAEKYWAMGNLSITVVAGIALGLLTGYEVSVGAAASLQKKTSELTALATDIGRLPLQAAPALANTVETRTAQLLDLTTQAIQQLDTTLGQVSAVANQADQLATQANATTRTYTSDFTINAINMSFNSSYPVLGQSPLPAPPASTTITLNADGVNGANGIIHATATSQVTIAAGTAGGVWTAAAGAGNVTLNCGATGTLTLQRTNVPVPGQMIQMTAQGITIQHTPAGDITIDAGLGTLTLRAGPASIVLSGQAGTISISGSSITLDGTNGITAQADATENSIQIMPQGIQIAGLTNKITAQIQQQTQNLAQQVTTQGEAIESIAMYIQSS